MTVVAVIMTVVGEAMTVVAAGMAMVILIMAWMAHTAVIPGNLTEESYL